MFDIMQVCILKIEKNDYSTPYTSFPFITPNFTKAGVIPILETFYDRLFPY